MDENPPQVSHEKRIHKTSRSRDKRSWRFAAEDAGDSVKCSGNRCESCTAALIADCVAICCCPVAILSLLALAFFEVPYMVGRRCLSFVTRKEMKRKCERIERASDDFVMGRDVNFTSGREKEGKSDIAFEFGDEGMEQRKSFSAGEFEAENFFDELFMVGQQGFGRVSFTGIQSQAFTGKGN
ncbi:hypothetical protein Nepgr_026048 [Nepenthes gracilis]|uniref:Transmembrane protein n=1 Tax=Nepenthes gracilis TaxID=150966 RepID=A0AAD3T763_NEPGR|nr:hypothetical protein Nepgr_026048 [Nepenthes gracilis]